MFFLGRLTGVEKSTAAEAWLSSASGLVEVVMLLVTIHCILTARNVAGKLSLPAKRDWPRFSLCAGAVKRLTSSRFVRWCNGNTAPFGGVIHGSNPCRTAIYYNENEGQTNLCTEFAQNPARPADKRMRFPVTIRHRTSKAKIYAPAGKFAYYRVAFTAAGKRKMQT